MAKKEDKSPFLVEDLIIEGILAGVFRTCDAVELTPFGEWLIKPFQTVLDREGYAKSVVDKIVPADSAEPIKDTAFLHRFVEIAVDANDQDALLNVLNREPYQQSVAAALGAASVQFGVFLCLCGVHCRMKVTEKGLLVASDGKLFRPKK